MFSIIIPSFNSAKVIGRAIQSIIEQKNTNFEVIIQDAGSTDGTDAVVKQYTDSRIKFFCEKDGGIFDGMNRGIRHSEGKWLVFLGSDDALYDERVLETIQDVFLQNKSTRFIYGDVLTSAKTIQRYNDYSYFRLLEKCICHQSIFYHRSLFKKYQYDQKFKICADWDFNLKVFRARNRPIYVPIPLAYFNLDGVSANWEQQSEYIDFFSNKRQSILRYRGWPYLLYYFCHLASISLRSRIAIFKESLGA